MGGANTGNRLINVFQELKASQGECKISKIPKPEAFRKKEKVAARQCRMY